MTSLTISDPSQAFVLQPDGIPNANWLRPGMPGAGQQAFGDQLIARHFFVVIPSVVSTHSWNLIFDRDVAAGRYGMAAQEDFALDTRLHPPARA